MTQSSGLTVEMIRKALKGDAARVQARIDEGIEREKNGLPSWDIILSPAQWEATRDEGMKQGIVTKHKDHYRISVNFYPPARVILAGKIGEDIVIPGENG